MVSLYRNIKSLFTKEEVDLKSFQPFIVNKFLSFGKETINVAVKMDKYIFRMDKEMAELVYKGVLPKQRSSPYFHYIRSPGEQLDEFAFIINPLRRYFQWSDQEFTAMKPFLSERLKDRQFLYSCLCFIGASKSYFKKYGFELGKQQILEV